MLPHEEETKKSYKDLVWAWSLKLQQYIKPFVNIEYEKVLTSFLCWKPLYVAVSQTWNIQRQTDLKKYQLKVMLGWGPFGSIWE